MIRRTTVLAGTFAIICASKVLLAQSSPTPQSGGVLVAAPKTPPARPEAGRPRIAGIAPPPAVVPNQNGMPTAGFIGNAIPQVAAFYYLPAVVLTDGRVFANFGGRYEQVLRRCPVTSGTVPPGFTTSTCWVVDAYGRYQVVQQR